MEHSFTANIKKVLEKYFKKDATAIYENSSLIQYINLKTKSANKGSKARSSFSNLYAIYVIIEDYINNGFVASGKYKVYEGAKFTNLLKRQRELPFGSKLQNHSLNHRMNSEFQKYFPALDIIPILRDIETNRYWFNENLIIVKVSNKKLNIAMAIIDIIDDYINTKQDSFNRFIKDCVRLQQIGDKNNDEVIDFINELLKPNVDARLFEIISYAILKYHFKDQNIIWGYDMENLNIESLALYKTGRTNANDGGIDFVMKPLGRFFQVTETLDFKKYFLDIEKIEKYPITFVIKTDDAIDNIHYKLQESAKKTYIIESIVDKYIQCIEEIINIPTLKSYFKICCQKGFLKCVLDEIILQSKLEFNYKERE